MLTSILPVSFTNSGVCVFVITNPSATLPVISVVYFSTSFSVTVYTISFPFSNFGKFSNTYDQFPCSSAFTSTVVFTFPSVNKFTYISSGLYPSWSFASFQSLLTSILPVSFTNSGVCVFVITNPSATLPVISVVYFSTSFSVTVYTISFPFSNFGKFSNTYDQFPCSSAFTSTVVFTFPSVNKFTYISSGLYPSWSFASFQSLLTVISIAIGSSTSSVSFPPTVATFVILFSVRSSKLSTITINVLDTDSPAGTVTFFHSNLVLFSEIIAPSAEFSFNIVPVGTLSLIVVTPSTSPVFVTLIVYVISSPILATSTLLPSLVISLVLLLVIIAVFSSLLS